MKEVMVLWHHCPEFVICVAPEFCDMNCNSEGLEMKMHAIVFSAVIWYFCAHNFFVVCGHPVGWGTALQAWRSQLQLMMVSLVLFIDIILPATLWPGDPVDLASNRSEYQEYFLGDKGSWCVGLRILPLSCASCLKICEPQHPGTLGACNRLVQGVLYLCFTIT
jgi:hypothetical protein